MKQRLLYDRKGLYTYWGSGSSGVGRRYPVLLISPLKQYHSGLFPSHTLDSDSTPSSSHPTRSQHLQQRTSQFLLIQALLVVHYGLPTHARPAPNLLLLNLHRPLSRNNRLRPIPPRICLLLLLTPHALPQRHTQPDLHNSPCQRNVDGRSSPHLGDKTVWEELYMEECEGRE